MRLPAPFFSFALLSLSLVPFPLFAANELPSLESIQEHCSLSLDSLFCGMAGVTPFYNENFYAFSLTGHADMALRSSMEGCTIVAVLNFTCFPHDSLTDRHLLRLNASGSFPYMFYPMAFIPKPAQGADSSRLALAFFRNDDEYCSYNDTQDSLSSLELPPMDEGYVAMAITCSAKGSSLYANGIASKSISTSGNGEYSSLYLSQEAVDSGFLHAAYAFDTALTAEETLAYSGYAVERAAETSLPVPEPTPCSLFLLGMGLWVSRRRRRP